MTKNKAKTVEHWEERAARLAVPENFHITFAFMNVLQRELSEPELARFRKKQELVRKAAQHLLANMLKGTIKYRTDSLTVEQWLAHSVDEAADLLNYMMLLTAAMERRK